MTKNPVDLYCNGQIWGEWTAATVTKSIDAVFGEATLELTRQKDSSPDSIPSVSRDDACRLELRGNALINGLVTARNLDMDAGGFDMDVTIRDKTALLFKGCVMNIPAEWANQKAEAIIRDICTPFGVAVRALVDTGAPFVKFTGKPGETAQKMIERICRHRALLFFADANGGLILTTAASAPLLSDNIVFGKGGNATAMSLKETTDNRHNEYVCRTQSVGSDWGASNHTKVEGRAFDKGIKTYCPQVIIADEPGDTDAMNELAVTTAAINAARANERTYTVPGWTLKSGQFWPICARVPVRDAVTGLNRELLIKRAVFKLNHNKSEETLLSVVDPKGYTMRAEPEDTGDGSVW